MILDRVKVIFNAVGGRKFIQSVSGILTEAEHLTDTFGLMGASAVMGTQQIGTTLEQQKMAWLRASRRARFMSRALRATGLQSRLSEQQIRNLTRTTAHLDEEVKLAAGQMTNLRKAFLYAGFGAWIAGAVFRKFGSDINKLVEGTIQNYADWEWHLTRTQTLLQATSDQMVILTTKLKGWATEGIYSLSDVTQLVEQLALAGFDLNEVLTATPAILQMATMEGMDLSEAASIAAAAMRAYGYEAEDMAAISNAMALTSARSAVEVHDLGESLKYSGTLAGLLNASILETNAVLGIAGQRFIRGGKAGRYLSQAFQKLIKYGYSFRGGLIPALEQLRQNLAGLNEEQKIQALTQMVGMRAARLLAAVIGARYDELKAFLKLQDQAIVVTSLQAKYDKEAKDTFESMIEAVRNSKDPMQTLREEYGLSRLEAEAFIGLMEQGNDVIQETIKHWDDLLTAQKVAHNQLTTLTASIRRLNETWNILYMSMIEPMTPVIKVVNEILRNLINNFQKLPVSIRFLIGAFLVLAGILLTNIGVILYLVGAISLLISSLVQLRAVSALTGRTLIGLAGIFEAAGISASSFFAVLKTGITRLLPVIGLIALLVELLFFLQDRFHIFDPLLKWLGLLKDEANEAAEAVNAISYGHSPGGLVDVIKFSKELKSLTGTFEPMYRYPEVAITSPTQPVKHETIITPTINVNINGAEIVDLESLHVFQKTVRTAVAEALDEVSSELMP